MAGLPGGCNPADVLYKLAHARGIKAPAFEQVSEQGPAHCKTFTWSCSFVDGQYKTVASGRTKKEARNATAKCLIEQLDLSTLPQKPQRQFGGRGGAAGGKRKNEERNAEGGEGNNGVTVKEEQGDSAPAVKKNKKMMRGSLFGAGMGQGGWGAQAGFTDGGMMGGGRGFGSFFGGPHDPSMMGMGMDMGMGGMVGMGMNMGGMGMGHLANGPMRGGLRHLRQHRMPCVFEDRHVIERHKAIYPGQEELDTLLQLVDTIEKGLKKVSDKFISSNGSETNGDGDSADREVMGVARVSDLAKGLLLTGDKEVQLVVMCRNKPTITQLQTVADALKPELTELMEGVTNFEIYLFPEEACFCVTSVEEGSSEVPYQVRVTLTSTQHRTQEEEQAKVKEDKDAAEENEGDIKEEKDQISDEKAKETVSPPDLLPKDKCLEGLAELRHSKWFTAMAAPLTSCVETIRVLRDLAQREEAWAALGHWATELLVERALFSAGRVLSPSNCLLRIMEVVASGVLQADGPGIRDPCEREEVDVVSHLSLQEREDITRYAMEAVRKIHFRKIHQVLGMERIGTKPVKTETKEEKEETVKKEEVQ